ncbi:uncharacterized protein LOC109415507 [Aedes albopictus]|uniref:Ionotropic glutamate receptor C-terminal domain-containing protein n=1 Tax=Aedes albopictus TaxID=7160 RepID=A0ABM1ZXM0_AEDAL
MIGALLERRVDIAIGGVSVWHHLFPHFTFTATLQRVGINCLTPRPRILPSWLTLVNAFTDVVWVVFVVCFACNSLALYFITKRKEPFYAVQQVFAALLLQGTTLRKRSFSEVIFTISILMTANNLALIYLGKEASMRNFPQQSRSIETIDELADSGLHWNAPHEAWKYSLLTSENPSIKVLLNTFQVLSPSSLVEKADEGKENFAFVRLNFGHYMFGPWINEGNIHFYRPMSEDIYWEHETVWTTKTWPFLEPFNRHIMLSVEAGLQQYEELVLAKKYLSYTVQIEIEHSRDRLQRQPSALEFSDVYGILVLLLMGLGASFVAFAVEMVWYKTRDPN